MWRRTHKRHIHVALDTSTPHTCGVGHVNASKTAKIWHKNTNLSAFRRNNEEIVQKYRNTSKIYMFFIAFTAKRRTFDKILKLLYKNIGIL